MTRLYYIFITLLLSSCGLTQVNLDKAKVGKKLNKAQSVNPQEYFNNFYDTGMNSSWDNSWYNLYESNDFIYYGQKNKWSKKRLQYFKKVNKDSLLTYLPGYTTFNADRFSQIIYDNILSKIDNIPNSCSTSTGRLEHNYKLINGDISVRFTYTKICDRTSTTIIRYNMILSGKDLTVLSSKIE